MLSHDECWALLSAGASEQVEAVRVDDVLYLMHLEKTCALALQASSLHVFCGAHSYALAQPHWTQPALSLAVRTCVAQLRSQHTLSPRQAYLTLLDRLAPLHSGGPPATEVGCYHRSEFKFHYTEAPARSTWLTFKERSLRPKPSDVLCVRTRLHDQYVFEGLVDTLTVDVISCYVLSPMELDVNQPWGRLLRTQDTLERVRLILLQVADLVSVESRQASDNQMRSLIASGSLPVRIEVGADAVLRAWQEGGPTVELADSVAVVWSLLPMILSPTIGLRL